ncbi:MAG TPA: class I SAM-dependent methyltransferase [Actinobacteria bacterium]|nr:class I SAM-dependent methyltransferase [Actinomycetota bacterium]
MDEKHEAPGISERSETAQGAWDERYSEAGLVWGRDANAFVVDQLEGLSPRRVLDLGCGQGRNALWLASQGHDVTGLDLSPVAIDQAKEMARASGLEVSFSALDLATDWRPSADAFDLVVLSYLQLPESARKPIHAKAVETLAPGGMIFLIAHHPDNLDQGVGGPPYPEVMFDEAELAEDFAELNIERNEKVLRPVDQAGATKNAIDIVFVGVKLV